MTGAQFRWRRRQMNMSITSLAERLGVHRQTIWSWETEHNEVPKMAALLMELWWKHGY